MKIPPTLSGKLRLMETARTDADLQAQLSMEAASAFGAFPIGFEEETLVVAVPRWADMRLYPLLGVALQRPVRPVPMEPDIVMGFIAKVYLSGDMPNFHTFPDPDFAREENAALLVSGKVEPAPPPRFDAPADALVLCDMALLSELDNLDRAEQIGRAYPGDQAIPFTRRNGDTVVFEPAPPPGPLALGKISFLYRGLESMHGFRVERRTDMPAPLHPTELQWTAVEIDGSCGFWVFDATRVVRPGNTAEMGCTYHFLNFGNRYRRALTLRVLDLRLVSPREARFHGGETFWTVDDFERWFGAPFE